MGAHLSSATIAIWGDAMVAALKGDRRELVDMLECKNEVTPDVIEFLAWLLKEKKRGRAPLPAKFKWLQAVARNPALLDAVTHFEIERANWYAAHPRRVFPYATKLEEFSRAYGVDPETLNNKLRRSRKIRV